MRASFAFAFPLVARLSVADFGGALLAHALLTEGLVGLGLLDRVVLLAGHGDLLMNCERCGEPCVLRAGMFYWRGEYFPGWVCNACNALWPNPDFEAAVTRTAPPVPDTRHNLEGWGFEALSR